MKIELINTPSAAFSVARVRCTLLWMLGHESVRLWHTFPLRHLRPCIWGISQSDFNFKLVFIFALFSGPVFSSVNSEVGVVAAGDAVDTSMDSLIEKQQGLLSQMDGFLKESKMQLRQKTEAFYQIQQKPAQGPMHVWQKADPAGNQKKDFGLKILGLALKENVKEVEILESRRLEAQAELEWLLIQRDEIELANPEIFEETNLKNRKNFQCRILPLNRDQDFEVTQSFGPQKDLETGIEWNSMGWWLAAMQAEVKACDGGRVVFVGDISGRGRVIMLDHGAGHLTVYANLNPDTVKLIKKGQNVAAGTLLGFSLDRVYFEYRNQGTASDPKNVLKADLLTRVTL